jgi:hypothetical protein
VLCQVRWDAGAFQSDRIKIVSELPLFKMVVVGALSLSLGWGIRGNFGHAYGALVPGALAALAVVLVSGRQDWWQRISYFGLFGALGWSFGGTPRAQNPLPLIAPTIGYSG